MQYQNAVISNTRSLAELWNVVVQRSSSDVVFHGVVDVVLDDPVAADLGPRIVRRLGDQLILESERTLQRWADHGLPEKSQKLIAVRSNSTPLRELLGRRDGLI